MNVSAHPVADHHQGNNVHIIMLAENAPPAPVTENGNITLDGLNGPKDSKGIASIEPKGIIDLGVEFPVMAGRQLRARLFTVEPGGVVGIHTHIERPGYAFIISGRIMEHRNDTPDPIEHTAGSVAMEKAGVTHWWENTFDEPVKALVVDIFKPE
ncbi:MAG: cupin domain-containing protein [Gammaproteobacteria bacterium]